MLYVSLVLSALLLIAVNIHPGRPGRPTPTVAVVALFLSFVLPFACFTFLPPVALQAALLCVTWLVWRGTKAGTGRFRGASVVATALAYLPFVWLAERDRQELAALRDRFPYESMDGRVPLLPVRAAPPPFDAARLDALENEMDAAELVRWRSRAFQLERLHDRAVQHFVNSPGFGVTRMMGPPTERGLTQGLHDGPAPDQPAPWPLPSDPDLGAANAPTASPDQLAGLHERAAVGFAHPAGFGFAKDRGHVAGFQAHGFAEVPAPAGDRAVAQLELVSLLLHPTPVVYVSDRLPRMDAVRGCPTRPLTGFEADGLDALRRGDEVFVRGDRMVGALRATKQCLGCHGGNRGDLLGALAYTLRPVASRADAGK